MDTKIAFGPKKLVKIKEAADLLDVSSRWVYSRIADGTLRLVKLKGASRIALSDLEKFVEESRR